MKLFLIRHAKAIRRIDWNHLNSDFDRPLREEGILEFKNMIEHLKIIHEIDHIYSSSLLRTVETAKLLSAKIDTDFTYHTELNEGNAPKKMLDFLKRQKEKNIAYVGHGSEIPAIIDHIFQKQIHTSMKKGAITIIDNYKAYPQLLALIYPRLINDQ